MKINYKIKNWIQGVKNKWPLMTKKQHHIEVAREATRYYHQYEKQLEEELVPIKRIVDRCTELAFRTDDYQTGHYSIMITFDPMAFGRGMCTSEELRIMAKMVARRVEAEIATARFIQKTKLWK